MYSPASLRRFLRYTSSVVQLAVPHLPHDLREVGIDGLIGEQALIEFALHLLGESRPVAAHDLHADELDAVRGVAVAQAGIALARAARAVACVRQEQPQVQLFEFELEAARYLPVLADVAAIAPHSGRRRVAGLVRASHRDPRRAIDTNRLSVSP